MKETMPYHVLLSISITLFSFLIGEISPKSEFQISKIKCTFSVAKGEGKKNLL